MSNILLFGASGFLGKHLAPKLEAYGTVERVSSGTFDLMKLPTHFRIMREYDYIFLCTNWFRPGNFNVSADEFINNNVINNHVLWYWKNIQPQATLVTFGSDAAYDENEEPIEENYLKGFPNSSYYSYGLTKRFLYQGLIEIHKQTQSPYLHFPLISIFGANFKFDDEHLMHAITKKIINAKMLNEKASFWGDGSQTREITFVEDVVENIVSLTLDWQMKSDIFNLGSEKRFTVRSMVEQVCQHVGYDIADVEFDASKTVGINSKRLDSTKARTVLPNYKDTPMNECISVVCDYYIKNRFDNH